MKNLFLVDGAAGTGKSDLLHYIRMKYAPTRKATVLSKFTTRPRRKEEVERQTQLDLEFVTQDEFVARSGAEPTYVYEYGGHQYGFTQASLNRAFQGFENVFVIVRSRSLITQLAQDYSSVHVVVPVFIYTDRDTIGDRLRADGYDEDAIAFRLGRQNLVWNDYLRHFALYSEVLINNSSMNDLQRLIDQLLDKYSKEPSDCLVVSPSEVFPLPRHLIGFKPELKRFLREHPYERNVFLMMKFRGENQLVFDFISGHLASRGYNCVRADHVDLTGNVNNPVAVLHCCKYGIALFDEREEGNIFSPNVAYELGMMHLQRKTCLILRHTSLPQLPFDLISDLHRVYTKDLEMRGIILTWLDSLDQGRKQQARPASALSTSDDVRQP